jgi:hypothetical protein
MIQECFSGQNPLIIATGGFASLFTEARNKRVIDAGLFDEEIPELVLQGIFLSLKMNT